MKLIKLSFINILVVVVACVKAPAPATGSLRGPILPELVVLATTSDDANPASTANAFHTLVEPAAATAEPQASTEMTWLSEGSGATCAGKLQQCNNDMKCCDGGLYCDWIGYNGIDKAHYGACRECCMGTGVGCQAAVLCSEVVNCASKGETCNDDTKCCKGGYYSGGLICEPSSFDVVSGRWSGKCVGG